MGSLNGDIITPQIMEIISGNTSNNLSLSDMDMDMDTMAFTIISIITHEDTNQTMGTIVTRILLDLVMDTHHHYFSTFK